MPTKALTSQEETREVLLVWDKIQNGAKNSLTETACLSDLYY